MFEKEIEDWKDFLQPEDKRVLAELLGTTKKHQCAYCQAEDVKVAQLWCALVELTKEMRKMKDAQDLLREPFSAIVEIGEAEKKKAIKRVIRDMVRPTDESSEQATEKLVESLMKF